MTASMASINYALKEISCKIVYYGPGMSGKTTNLQFIHSRIPQERRGNMVSLATQADRTLFFDFLPVDVGAINGFNIKLQLYTVPGQAYYNATRKLVLRGVDGIVFVADSQSFRMADNLESFNNMRNNLGEFGYSLDDVPLVLQYNKRDAQDAAPVDELETLLNRPDRAWLHFEAVATTGQGVFATLNAIGKMVIERLRQGRS